MAPPVGSSSSSSSKWNYDVFLSFHGEDTRWGFVGHLHHSLCQRGIRVFLDDECIRTGEEITPSLFKAIQESRIAIIVFSQHYATSTFCLEELAKILECFKEEDRLIYPVFYFVDPSELRRPRGSYAEALARLEERFKDDKKKVETWRLALSQAANLKGCHIKNKVTKEHDYITRIVSEVSPRINHKPLDIARHPVGLESREEEVILRLDLSSPDRIKMVGITGAGGIGKSTIARALYNSIASDFEGSCFLSEVRKKSKMPNGLSHLQKMLLRKLVMEKDLKLDDFHEGIQIIKCSLCRKKILLILDDVDELDQLEALAGSCDWFGCGSRIIITTRNKQLLASHGVGSIYDVKELNHKESLQLLSWYAFKKENVDPIYMEVCNRAIFYSSGFPLVLEVIGSSLYGKKVNEWSDALDQCKRIPNKKVFEVLKLSYDALEDFEKTIFLDLTCFFKGEKLEDVKAMLLCFRGIRPEYSIRVLIDKSLIKIEGDRLTMHDLIEDIGKEIVRQESPNEPGGRSRLWFYQDILDVLQLNKGTDKVEAMILDLQGKVEWSGKAFNKMENLKMLVIKNASFSTLPEYLPPNLRWLEWKGYPLEVLSCNSLTGLVGLDLSCSYVELLQPFEQLSECRQFVELPLDLGKLINLCYLDLSETKLEKLPDSICTMCHLQTLKLFQCFELVELPLDLGKLINLRYLDLSVTRVSKLPDTICKLYNLETLKLRRCKHLEELPRDLHNLTNLRHLNLTDTKIKKMPINISRLKNLQILNRFFVGKLHGANIKELGKLNDLQCRLKISQLENVNNTRDASEARMKDKKNLDELYLEWSRNEDSRNERLVLEALQPCTNLKKLHIINYGGTKFVDWIDAAFLPNLVTLELKGCEYCSCLPPLGQLPSLKELEISGLGGITKIGSELYGGNRSSAPFSSLETLSIADMEEWEEWSCFEGECFPCLEFIRICNCPKLRKTLPPHLPCLERLEIEGCGELEIISFPMEAFSTPKLGYIVLSGLTQLKSLHEDMHALLPSLWFLNLYNCPELQSVPQSGRPGSLYNVSIMNCPKLIASRMT